MMYDVDAVLIAVGITSGIVVALTLFAFQVSTSFLEKKVFSFLMSAIPDQMGLHGHGRYSGVSPVRPHDLRHSDDLHPVLQVHADGVWRGGGHPLLLLPGVRHPDDDGRRPQVLHLSGGVCLCG